MAYAEKRGNLWRARWQAPDGTSPSKSGFPTRRSAEQFGQDKESSVRSNTYVDSKSGQILLTDWANTWFSALDLEPTTMSNYRYRVEVHILPEFGDRTLSSLTHEEIGKWEAELSKSGLSRGTARDIRSTFTTLLADALPRHIQVNPAARRKGKGRKGQRRIERIERGRKAWASPTEALLVAERAAKLSGSATDFTLVLTIAYTGMRWSEAIGLPPECIRGNELDIHWKLYELNGQFYRGRPKDGSMRTVDIPPFLSHLLREQASTGNHRCTCTGVPGRDADVPWCSGGNYVFLGPRGGHFRRSNYSERIVRPAADGWYPKREGMAARARMPVLVDLDHPWPGKPMPPWPAAEPGQPYEPPTGRGRARIAPEARLGSWLPVLPGLTPHGLRHGHQTWMDEAHASYVLQSERMGHEVPGMRGVYAHVSPRMRSDLIEALQGMWERSMMERAQLASGAIDGVLGVLQPTRRRAI
jgi:integrase